MLISIFVYFTMELITKSERDLIGIDSLERAITLGALLVRKGLKLAELPTNSVLLYQDFTNTPEGRKPNLTCEVKIPYNQPTFLGLGADFLEAITPFYSNLISYDGDAVPPTENNFYPLPSEPENLSLEKYLVWAMSEWIIINKANNPENWNVTGYLSFLEEANPAVVSAKVILNFDYTKYLHSKNVLAGVIPNLSLEQEFTTLVGEALFGDSFFVGN